MKKFAVFSGFLGSGKTTTMMALTKYYSAHCGKAAMISNDLGHGVELADDRFARLCGCNATGMTEECICYQHGNLAARLDACFGDGCDLVISDIPGFGVGALEHVYHGMTEDYPGKYALAPFTVLTEPDTVRFLQGGGTGDLRYLYESQLAEADLIVLNKSDLLSARERKETESWLREHYPEAEVLTISALRGEGLGELARALKNGTASMRRPDIGYGGEAFLHAMGSISEYYLQYYAAVCCNDFDGNAYLADIAEAVRRGVEEAGDEIPHLKLLAWSADGDFGKADLTGIRAGTAFSRRFERPCTEIAVTLNASAVSPEKRLDRIITDAAEKVSGQYLLELTIHKKECFGMG